MGTCQMHKPHLKYKTLLQDNEHILAYLIGTSNENEPAPKKKLEQL